jgi:DNA-binding transcriptional regulator YiaG
MSTDLLERPRGKESSTNAGVPFASTPKRIVATRPPTWHASDAQPHVTGFTITSTGYDLHFRVQTQADPLGLVAPEPIPTASAAIYEIRRLSGLTWDELAHMFAVTRQAVTDWANGKPLKPQNLQKVTAILTAMRTGHRTTAGETRAALLARLPSGSRPIDLFHDNELESAVDELQAARLPTIAPPSARERRLPHPVDLLERYTDRGGLPATGPPAPASRRMRRVKLPKP